MFRSGEMGKSAQGAKGLKMACEGRKEGRETRERSSRNGQEEGEEKESGSPELPAGNVSAQSLHWVTARKPSELAAKEGATLTIFASFARFASGFGRPWLCQSPPGRARPTRFGASSPVFRVPKREPHLTGTVVLNCVDCLALPMPKFV